MTTPTDTRRRIARWVKREAGALVGSVALLAVLGVVYQSIAAVRDEKRYPPPGKMVNVGGHRLHLHCSGQGSPAVIFESGVGDFSLQWRRVQPQVARFTEACSYDRAGLGWSESGPSPRTSRQIASELDLLLSRAGIGRPIVLAGQSAGGLHARLYASQHPGEIAGLVFVDSSIPENLIGEKGKDLTQFANFATQHSRRYLAVSGLAEIGVVRLYLTLNQRLDFSEGDPTGDEEISRYAQPQVLRGVAAEWAALPEAAMEAEGARDLGHIPVVVLTATADYTQAFADEWKKEQAGLLRLSPNSRQIVLKESGHDIPNSDASTVVEAIREVVEAARTGRPLRKDQ